MGSGSRGLRELNKALAADGRLPVKGIEVLIAEEMKVGVIKEKVGVADLTDATFIEHFARLPK